MKIVEMVKKYTLKLYDKNDIVHGWPHIVAVRENALKLQKVLGGNKESIELAAYFHDCDYSRGIKKHAEASAAKAEKYLNSINYDKTKKVVEIIRNHALHLRKPDASLEAKILFDADKMETIKPYGILRVAIFHKNLPHKEMINMFHKYCFGAYDKLYFDESRKMIKKDYEKTKKIIGMIK